MDVYEEYISGFQYLKKGMLNEAIFHLRRAKTAEPFKTSIREALARAYFMSGRFDKSEKEFSFIIHLKPDCDYAYFGAGLSLIKLGEKEKGLEKLKIACALNPSNQIYRNYLKKFS